MAKFGIKASKGVNALKADKDVVLTVKKGDYIVQSLDDMTIKVMSKADLESAYTPLDDEAEELV